MLLLSMVGGAAADRHDKRTILMACLAMQVVLAVLVGVLIYQNAIALWHLIAIAAVLGVVNAFEMPAVSALVPELVSQERIKDAVALDRALFHATRLVGPAVAGIVITAWGTAVAFFVNAASFLPLMIALQTLPKRPMGTAEEEEARSGGMGDALTFVRRDRPTLAMVGLLASTTIFIFPIMLVMLPFYAKDVLGMGAGSLGVMMSSAALGSLVGSLALMGIAPHHRRRVLTIASVGISAAVAAIALAQHLAVAAGALVVLSLSLSAIIGLSNTIVIERTPPQLRGRVSAVTGIASFGMMPFAGLAVTAYADVVGMRWAIGTGAAGFAVVALSVLLIAGKHINASPEAVAADPELATPVGESH